LLSNQAFDNLYICLKQLVRLNRNGVRHFKTGALKGPDLVQLFEGRGNEVEGRYRFTEKNYPNYIFIVLKTKTQKTGSSRFKRDLVI